MCGFCGVEAKAEPRVHGVLCVERLLQQGAPQRPADLCRAVVRLAALADVSVVSGTAACRRSGIGCYVVGGLLWSRAGSSLCQRIVFLRRYYGKSVVGRRL